MFFASSGTFAVLVFILAMSGSPLLFFVVRSVSLGKDWFSPCCFGERGLFRELSTVPWFGNLVVVLKTAAFKKKNLRKGDNRLFFYERFSQKQVFYTVIIIFIIFFIFIIENVYVYVYVYYNCANVSALHLGAVDKSNKVNKFLLFLS